MYAIRSYYDMMDPLSYENMYYKANINSENIETLYINNKETGEMGGALCTHESEIILQIFNHDNKVYFSSIIKKDACYTISVKCIDKNGKISLIGQPFQLPITDDEYNYIKLYGCITNNQIYLNPEINEYYSKYVLCINSENKSFVRVSEPVYYSFSAVIWICKVV